MSGIFLSWASGAQTLQRSTHFPGVSILPSFLLHRIFSLSPQHSRPQTGHPETTPPGDSHHSPLVCLLGSTDLCPQIFASCVFLSFLHQHVNSKRAEIDKIGLSALYCLTAQGRVGEDTVKDTSQDSSGIVWLAQTYGHGVPRNETDRKFTEVLLDLYKGKRSRSSDQKLNLHHKTREAWPVSQFPDLSPFTDPEPLEWRGDWVSWWKDPGTLLKVYTAHLSPSLPQKNLYIAFYQGNCMRKKEILRLFGAY